MPESSPVPQVSPSAPGLMSYPPSITSMSSRSAVESMASSKVSPVKLYDFNRAFGTTGVSPLENRDRGRIGFISSKIRRSSDAMMQMAEGVSTSSTPVAVPWECPDCNSLVSGMRTRLQDITDKRLQYLLLTCAPLRMSALSIHNRTGCTPWEATQSHRIRRSQGIFTHPDWQASKLPLKQDVADLVKTFNLSLENGKVSRNANDTVQIVQYSADNQKSYVRVPKHRMVHNLSELYSLFCERHGENMIVISEFAMLRPRQCIWPGYSGHHNVCMCVIHENYNLMLEAIQEREPFDYACKFMCVEKTKNCYLGLCNDCPNFSDLDELDAFFENEEECEYSQWETTDLAGIRKIVEPLDAFKARLQKASTDFVRHHYIMKQQDEFFRNLKHDLRENTLRLFLSTSIWEKIITLLCKMKFMDFIGATIRQHYILST